MKHPDARGTLIKRTIQVIAEQGLDKTTTKAVVGDSGINEAYIYRYFKDKEDLLVQTFRSLDEELLIVTSANMPAQQDGLLSCEESYRRFFTATWRFLLGNQNKCLAYIRYGYSSFFKKYSLEDHQQRFAPLVEKMAVFFYPEANVWMLLNHVLNVMLDFAIKVFNGEVPDNEDTAEHVFRLVFYSIKPYLLPEKREEIVSSSGEGA